ncbi:DNA polymerase delta subunit 3 [Hondaea fermentalgiana]|uniref:DNA polymerase delta subunit 3 n=1 Tax=Hondaea fermentalgiana TaxID=2315210 RepID=A0A2R5GV18_9STRA|nr:DNA polymerase delta subunit 3 [Hondaea fermentalgiana]|eukprot:GBG33618.1 DNA polymerase delta subunit 3 [Hondaea fermentalgiana]
MGAQDEDLQSEIERLVLVDDQCVTYKWLAYERGMAMKDAQEALRQFAAQRSDETKKRSVVTYLVTGRSKSSKVAHNVKIVREDKLEAVKAKMDVVLATHIYAVQPAVDTDTSTALANTTHAKVCDLLNSDDSVSKDLIENRLGAVSFSGRGGIGSRRVVAEPRRNKVFTRPAGEGPSFVAPAFKRMNSKGTKKISSKDFFKQKKPAASTGPATKEKEKEKKMDATENSDTPSASSLRASDELSEKSSLSPFSNKNNTTANNNNNNNKKKVNSDPASESTKKTARSLDDGDDKETEAPRKKKKLKVLEDDSDEDEFELDDAVQDQNVNSKKNSKEASNKSEKDTVAGSDEKTITKKLSAQEPDERIDQDGDHQLADAEDSENDADRVARQREALANEEAETRAKEKAEKREAEREANRLARQERKRKEEEAAKAKARERLGVQISKPGAQTGATRKVKKRRVVKETVEDDEGFLVVRERVIEEEVDEPIPESISSASSSDKKEAKGAATSTKTSTSKTAKKPGTKPKQLTLSSMFKKK